MDIEDPAFKGPLEPRRPTPSFPDLELYEIIGTRMATREMLIVTDIIP